MSNRRFGLLVGAVVLVVTGLTALGVGVRATYGAQTTADEPQYLLSALSLWEDGDLDISDELAAGEYRAFHEVTLPQQTRELADGRRLSPHSPLLPLLLAVPMGLWGWVGAKVALASMAGALAGLTVWVTHRRLGVRPITAVVVVGIFSLSPPLAMYATQVYPALAGALAVAAGIGALTGRPGVRSTITAVVAVVALPWLAVKFVPVAAVLALATLLWAPGRYRVWILAVLGAAGVIFVAFHWGLYGGLTPYAAGDHFIGGEFTAVGAAPNLWGRSTRLVGLLVDRGFGLASWQPAFLLLPVAAAVAFRGRFGARRLVLGLVGTGWLVATFMALTMHGWWFPGRQLVVVLPAVVVVVAQWADTTRVRLAVSAVLGSVGMGSFAFLAAEGLAGRLTWAVDFASTTYPLYQALTPLLPDYMAASPGTWMRHAVWLAALIGLLAVGFRTAMPASESRGALALEKERHAI